MDDSPTPPNLHTITTLTEHDTAISKAQGTLPAFENALPTLIYVSSASNPSCQTSLPKVLNLARTHPSLHVYILELTAAMSPYIKFGPQNTPIFILMAGKWCETVLGPDFRRVEMLVRSKFGEGE